MSLNAIRPACKAEASVRNVDRTEAQRSTAKLSQQALQGQFTRKCGRTDIASYESHAVTASYESHAVTAS
jgi:hypothetical protein